jgi:hypothetical protein
MAVEFVGLQREIEKALAPHLAALSSGAAFEMDFSFPISKVDASRREVTGVATDESVDAHGEILDYAASKAAFAAWEKNIREMHSNNAVGRAVSVSANDATKSITITARISRGAEPTWQKVLDGTLGYFSVGGTRLRSEIRSDGVRRTSEYRLGEVSLVDVGANPNTKFAISKSLSGRPVVTDVVALDTEANYAAAADAIDLVSIQLRAGTRPLPSEVTKALNLCGSPVVCDQLDPRDLALTGPGIYADLRACSSALRMATDLDNLEKARTVAALVLTGLVCRRDLAKSRDRGHRGGRWDAEGRGLSVESLREEAARALGQLRGLRGAEEAVEKLETNVMKLHTISSVVGGVGKSLFTAQELTEMRDKLSEQLENWHAKNWPQNTPEYRRLSDTYFLVSQRLKGK